MKCLECEKEKPEIEFSYRNRKIGKRQARCKSCNSQRYYVEKRTPEKIEKARAANKKRRPDARRVIWDYLFNHPCIDCGETDPIVLEFDHRKSSTKILGVSQMAGNGRPLSDIKEEIIKCQVLCANCHRRKTAKELNWYTIQKGENL